VFVTKDYCSPLHADDDLSEYTLMYSSHPDCTSEANGIPVDFVLGSYGARFTIRDSDLVAFNSSIIHGTIHRASSTSPVYIGGMVVNSVLKDLMKRRKNIE
jgi:hypothetical protein